MNKLRLLVPLTLAACLVVGLLLVLQPQRVEAVTPNPPVPEWYWKPGGWLDYAPSGVPDFDQKQGNWGFPPDPQNPQNLKYTYCGPVAAANSMWWFDSKFESVFAPIPIPPPAITDHYYLVTNFNLPNPFVSEWDDHDPLNVGGDNDGTLPPGTFPGLVDDLACYFQTSIVTGTEVHRMAIGLQEYLNNDLNNQCSGNLNGHSNGGSYYDDYHVQLVKAPTWEWVVDEVQRSEDVILLLGFWSVSPSDFYWERLGGHYVTVAGINDNEFNPQIAFSDPYWDIAETGGQGRVLSGTLVIPHNPGHASFVHNDAGNISHDSYPIIFIPPEPPPGNGAGFSIPGSWAIGGYPPPGPVDPNFLGQNTPVEYIPYEIGMLAPPTFAVVEYAIAVSPFYWKAGGEWISRFNGDRWVDEFWRYNDDADSCLPDFKPISMYSSPYMDGPTSLANSFWWFDSKAETLLIGDHEIPPPTVSDHYSMTFATNEQWDDHDPQNTDPYISWLGNEIQNTDHGTTPYYMRSGINDFLETFSIDDDFYTTWVNFPTWSWIADEVESSEDVILLLGFYKPLQTGGYERKGGHWVNAAGVNRDGFFIGLSDPITDTANQYSTGDDLHLGRVFPPEQLGTAFASKLNPQAISHDIYKVVTGPTIDPYPNHSFALEGYPAESFFDVYYDMNGGGSGGWEATDPISTVIEYAIGVSPYSDLEITKTVPISIVEPGERITYTLEYANTGFAAVQDVIISDTIPEQLSSVSYESYPPIDAMPGYTYVWHIPKLSFGQDGLITVTGIAPLGTAPYNRVTITGTKTIGGPTPDRELDDNWDEAGWKYYVYLPLLLR